MTTYKDYQYISLWHVQLTYFYRNLVPFSYTTIDFTFKAYFN